MTENQGRKIERDAILQERSVAGVAILRIASKPLGVLRISVKKALRERLAALETDPAIRVVILTGNGNAFSVGSDIRDFEADEGWLLAAEDEEKKLNEQIEMSRLAVIAACNGHCHGGGLVLAMACDLRIAADSAVFSLPEIKVGAFASAGGTQRVCQFLGKGRAMDMLLTGRALSGSEALEIGLIDRIAPEGELIDAATELAKQIASLPTEAIEASKRCVNEGLRYGWAQGIELETKYAVSLGLSEGAAEGQKAFLEKRAPRFNQD
ncbi:enoyl-CoA hydratase/isomerase family protein [Limibacillus sp. MBR-115]|jgi:enoyl-CoA hydratase/carnithine racemase|uniref:enoyl-CoA hydratase/isomerase family protein n=1 Tax=Limibacillus sp. MBR-115 TaxID=3156465 RepID=UPI0033922BF8